MQNFNSISVENFIKTIYQFELREGKDTRSGSIAKELGITNAAATDMARKLASKNIVAYQKYKALKLTADGKKMALHIVRRHRLWETFLHQVLGLNMHEIHQEAELLEHATSEFLLDKIDAFLGNPTTDPHGDPIPNKNGVIEKEKEVLTLSAAKVGECYEVCRLVGGHKEFYDFCQANKLTVGAFISINKQYPHTKMTEIEIGSLRISLHADLAGMIYLKKLKKSAEHISSTSKNG
ncbi:MAG: metal-dependent transcriptional regulator [Chitinophagales bacterium]|nr:metal-dependent transcriptional regulator [Bacteroidota bacterium]MCB9042569.1 metal-dependent transcriptional regulator [Chitinophagales bacterium]